MFEATRPISMRPRPDAMRTRSRPRPNDLAWRPMWPRGLNIPDNYGVIIVNTGLKLFALQFLEAACAGL